MADNVFLEKLTPENAVFLPVDYMHGLISACRAIDLRAKG